MNKNINKALNELYRLVAHGEITFKEVWSNVYEKNIYEVVYNKILFRFTDKHIVDVYFLTSQTFDSSKRLFFNNHEYPIVSEIYDFIDERNRQNKQIENENQFLDLFFGKGVR